MQQHQTSENLSTAQRAVLRFRLARGRALNLLSVLLAALVLGVTTIGAMAAPADAMAVVQDDRGTVYAAYQPSMMERAVIGLDTALSGDVVAAPMLPTGSICDTPAGAMLPECQEGYAPPPPMSICTATSTYGNTDTETLPVHRWTDATSTLHTRLSSKFYDDVMEKISRNGIQQGLMATGNMFWSTGVAMTEASAKFCIGDRIGRSLDSAMGDAAEAVFFNAGVGMALIVAGLVVLIYRTSRSGVPDLAKFGKLFLVAGFITAMITGATNTTTTSYGTMSPGWMLQKVNHVLGNTSGVLTAQLLGAIEPDEEPPLGTLTPSESYAADDGTHCYRYVDILRDHYDNKYALAGVKGMTAAPRALDSIWVQSGLQSYITTQYGSGNNYGDKVFCHQLELTAGVPTAEHARFTLDAWDGAYDPSAGPGTSYGRDIYVPRDNEMEDQVMVFWAACRNDTGGGSESAWTVAPGWDGVDNPSGLTDAGEVTPAECHAAYNSNGDYDWGGSPFNWTSKDAILDGTTHDPAPQYGSIGFDPRQFLLTYQGHAVGDGLVSAGVHAIVGFVVMLLFGLIALVVLIAKMAVMALMALVFFVAMFDMLVGRASSRLVKFAKLLLGLSIVTWMAGFLLAFLAFLTKVINDMGRAMDLNVVGGIIWAGIAPILAVAMIKFVFDKVLKIPDPLSVSGAKTYLGGAGTIGGATVDRAVSGASGLSSSAWSRLSGTPNAGGAGTGGGRSLGAPSSRGSLGGHSAGRGRDGAMVPDLPPQAGRAQLEEMVAGRGASAAGGAAAGAAAAKGAAPTRRGGGAGGAVPAARAGAAGADTYRATGTGTPRAVDRAGRPVSRTGGAASAARRSLLASQERNLYGKDGQNLPAEVAGAWGQGTSGRRVQAARMAREGRAIERQSIGGWSESGALGAIGKARNARKVQLAEREMERQARRADMGRVGKVMDSVGEAGRRMTSGKVAAGAGAVAMGASLAAAGTFAATTIAPAAAVGAAALGTAAAVRKFRDIRSGNHAARRAQRNDRSRRTFLAQRGAQVAAENAAEEGVETADSQGGDGGTGTRPQGPATERERLGGTDTGTSKDGPAEDGDGDDPVTGDGDGGGPDDGAPGDDGGSPASGQTAGPASGSASTDGPTLTGAAAAVSSGDAPGETRDADPDEDAFRDYRQGEIDRLAATPDLDAPDDPASEDRSPAWEVSYDDARPTSADQAVGDAPADQTPGPDGSPQGGDAAGPSGPGARTEARATARRDLWDHDGRPEREVAAERDVFDHDGVDDEAMANRRDVFDHDGRHEDVVAAERDVFDHDGRRDETVQARRDVLDHDGLADDAGGESFEEAQERRARQADERAAGQAPHAAVQAQSEERREHGRRLWQAMRDAEPGSPEQQEARRQWDGHRAHLAEQQEALERRARRAAERAAGKE